MNIIVCDDDEEFLRFLSQRMHSYFKTNEIPFSTKQFNTAEELLQYDMSKVNLIFLDIQMKGLNGIEIARILRRQNYNFILIFVSSYIEYAPLGYEIQAFRYVLKEQICQLFDELMDSVLKEMGYFRTKITLKFSFGPESFYTDNLIYVESKLHVVYFYFNKKVRHLYDTLDYVQQILPSEEFIRIHKSYLVNMHHLKDVRNYTAYLDTDKNLPISQKKFSEIKKKLFLYKGKL